MRELLHDIRFAWHRFWLYRTSRAYVFMKHGYAPHLPKPMNDLRARINAALQQSDVGESVVGLTWALDVIVEQTRLGKHGESSTAP